MKLFASCVLVFAALSLAPCFAAGSRLPPSQANALLDRAVAAYDQAKTIQATVTFKLAGDTTPTGGTTPATTTILEAQVENAPDGQAAHEKITENTDAVNSQDAVLSGGHWTSLYDGQTLYSLYAARKEYHARQCTDRFSDLFRLVIQAYRSGHGTIAAVRSSVSGRPSYVLSGRATQGIMLYAVVDCADHTLRQFSVTSRTGKVVASIVITNLRLNALLPPGISWKPPADYKERKTTNPATPANVPQKHSGNST